MRALGSGERASSYFQTDPLPDQENAIRIADELVRRYGQDVATAKADAARAINGTTNRPRATPRRASGPLALSASRCLLCSMEHRVSAGPAKFHFEVSQPTVTVTRAKPPSPPWYRYGIDMARSINWDHVLEVVQNILSDLGKYLRAARGRGPVPREKWVHRPTPRPSTSLRPDKARW